MLAQKCNAYIIGIDIDEEAVNQATDNGKKTPWSQRLHFEVENALTYIPQKKLDLITCNPPFFTNSLQCPGEKRNYARHSNALPFDARRPPCIVSRCFHTNGVGEGTQSPQKMYDTQFA